jgi:hypothetical protein
MSKMRPEFFEGSEGLRRRRSGKRERERERERESDGNIWPGGGNLAMQFGFRKFYYEEERTGRKRNVAGSFYRAMARRILDN